MAMTSLYGTELCHCVAELKRAIQLPRQEQRFPEVLIRTKTADDILASIARFTQSTTDSHLKK
jgi:hypothetical protein